MYLLKSLAKEDSVDDVADAYGEGTTGLDDSIALVEEVNEAAHFDDDLLLHASLAYPEISQYVQ
jgi:hypothetical protein